MKGIQAADRSSLFDHGLEGHEIVCGRKRVATAKHYLVLPRSHGVVGTFWNDAHFRKRQADVAAHISSVLQVQDRKRAPVLGDMHRAAVFIGVKR